MRGAMCCAFPHAQQLKPPPQRNNETLVRWQRERSSTKDTKDTNPHEGSHTKARPRGILIRAGMKRRLFNLAAAVSLVMTMLPAVASAGDYPIFRIGEWGVGEIDGRFMLYLGK